MNMVKVKDLGVSDFVLEWIENSIHRKVDTPIQRNFFIYEIKPTDEPNEFIVTYRVIGRVKAVTEPIRISRRTF